MRLLLVEDHAELSQWVSKALRHAGYVLDVLDRGDHADHALHTEHYDLVILDLSLPGLDGLEVLRRLRQREKGVPTPVLVLTARGATEERVRGLNTGADDYLTKPFLHEEVALRLRALHRRTQGRSMPVIEAGPLHYDGNADRFTLHGSNLTLTAQEQRILAYLIQNKDRVVSRAEISEHVYARDLDPDSNTLDVLLGRIRRKLGLNLIHTERGRGFCLRAPDDAR